MRGEVGRGGHGGGGDGLDGRQIGMRGIWGTGVFAFVTSCRSLRFFFSQIAFTYHGSFLARSTRDMRSFAQRTATSNGLEQTA